MKEASTTITNKGPVALEVWIEPWAEGIALPVGKHLVISGSSEAEGSFEVVQSESGVTVYAWPGGCPALC